MLTHAQSVQAHSHTCKGAGASTGITVVSNSLYHKTLRIGKQPFGALLSTRDDAGLAWLGNPYVCCAGVWEAINVLDAAYENKNEFQPRTLSIEVQDKPGVLNEVAKCP